MADAPALQSVFDSEASGEVLWVLAKMFIGTQLQRALIVEAKYGLGSRLQAYSSAKAVADVTSRALVVIWEKNNFCRADLRDLFQVPRGVYVLRNSTSISQILLSEAAPLFEKHIAPADVSPFSVATPSHLYISSTTPAVLPAKEYNAAVDSTHLACVMCCCCVVLVCVRECVCVRPVASAIAHADSMIHQCRSEQTHARSQGAHG
jgi:hypothetical protein